MADFLSVFDNTRDLSDCNAREHDGDSAVSGMSPASPAALASERGETDARPAADNAAAPAAADGADAARSESCGGLVVVVNGVTRSETAVHEMLGGAGFTIHDATANATASELVDVVRGARPALVVFDVGDKGPSPAVIAALKAEATTASTPILVVSPAGHGAAVRGRAREHGIDATLIAPVEPGELLATVDVLLTLGAERQRRLLGERQAAVQATLQATLQNVAFAHITDSIIVSDVNGRVMQWNGGAERIFGFTAAEMIGQRLTRIAWSPDVDLDAQLREHENPPPAGVEWQARTKSGASVWLHVHTTPIRNQAGAVIAYVGVAKDITDKREATALLVKRLEIEQHLIGMVSHDLRNPLNAVVLSVALLERMPLPEKAVRGVERIARATKRSLRLIDDLLDFTRARRGDGMPVSRHHGDLKAILDAVVDEVRPLFPGRELIVDAEPAPGDYDDGRMTQVLQNLINNALQHTTAGTPVRVTLTARGDDVMLAVWNGGPAIAPGLLPHLFEPYHQGPTGGRGADRGLGLGLFIAREAVKAHGGTIDVTSDPEKGTAFTVHLRRSSAPSTNGS